MRTLFPRIALLHICQTILLAAPDHYENFKQLAEHEKEGVDFKVDLMDRQSAVAVIAIHGGKIEPGSEAVARQIAGETWSQYIFMATKPKQNQSLHITSTHFDDPRALALVHSAKICISIHGFKEDQLDIVCVGGGNAKLRDRIAKQLSGPMLPWSVEVPCDRFGGSDPANIVNKAKEPGIQLELSTHFREKLMADPALLQQFCKVVQDALP
jgi:phage replication-related protein YjqB (UPF0714/DUF867 family)